MVNMMDKNKVIAIIGASNDSQKYGFKIYLDLKSSGYKVIPINPKEEFIAGDKCYKSILEYDGEVNTLDMVVPSSVGIKILDDAAKKGVKNVWFQPGSESPEAIAKAKNLGMNVVANACMMVEK